MLRGAEKRMIVVRTRGSRMFEEAYFILKPEKANLSQTRMITEANRIIEENTLQKKRTFKSSDDSRRGRFFFFLLGLLSGGSFLGMLWLFWG